MDILCSNRCSSRLISSSAINNSSLHNLLTNIPSCSDKTRLNFNNRFLRFYRRKIIWIFFGIVVVLILIGNQIYLYQYDSIPAVLIPAFSITAAIGIPFVIIFLISGFVKFYEIGKKGLVFTIKDNNATIKNGIGFVIISIIINIDIILLIKTGSLDYAFVIFPELERLLNQILGSLAQQTIDYNFSWFFDNNLIFRLSFLSFGSAVLIFLSHVRDLQKNYWPKKYPGIRLLMIFFLLSLIAIIVNINPSLSAQHSIDLLIQTIQNIVVLTIVFSSIMYLLDKFIFNYMRAKN